MPIPHHRTALSYHGRLSLGPLRQSARHHSEQQAQSPCRPRPPAPVLRLRGPRTLSCQARNVNRRSAAREHTSMPIYTQKSRGTLALEQSAESRGADVPAAAKGGRQGKRLATRQMHKPHTTTAHFRLPPPRSPSRALRRHQTIYSADMLRGELHPIRCLTHPLWYPGR